MSLAGELLSLVVSLAQEAGIVVGVGALTITLVGHLLSLHAHKNETIFGYVRAARYIRALALVVIIISGGAAILIHVQAGTEYILWAPAFLFKWLLIALLAAFYFTELKVDGIKRDAIEGFEGANWYALLIVHTMAPVVGWGLLLLIYIGWLITFGVIWAAFVWLMRRYSTLPPAKPGLGPNPFPPPSQAPAAPKPAIEIHPNHSMLPVVAELELPAGKPSMPAPSKVEVPAPQPESTLPHITVMPKGPQDLK